MNSASFLANIIGVLSLIALIAVIYPSLVDVFKINLKYKQEILKISQIGLLLTTTLGLIHGLLMTQGGNVDFYDLNTYWVYLGGVFLFNLVVFLAFSFSQLKSDIKRLNYFNYAILFLLVCHIGQKLMFQI